MAKITLSLKHPNAENSPIWATLSDGFLSDHKKIHIKIYPGISIATKHWSNTKRIVLSAEPNAVAINRYLKSFCQKALDIYLKEKEAGNLITGKEIKMKLEPQKAEKPLLFWELWDLFIASKKGIFKKHSFTKFGSLKGHLEAFEKFTKRKLDLEKISQEQLEDFQSFLYSERELNTQSTSKYIGIFKIFLNWCVKRRHTENIDFKYFTPIRQPDSLKVIISPDELEAIRKANLGEKQYLHNTRQLFILSCLVGLRYSDYSRISKEHLKYDSEGNPYLQIRQQKTEDIIELPLTNEAESIVKSIFEKKIHRISNQKMNTYVKELCKIAGINEPFEKTIYKGRDKKIEQLPKYELISTHTGRRTFATNLLNKGVPAEVVMKFTGHRDYKSFSKYVNIPKRTEMELVRNALMLDSSVMKIA